MQPISHRFAVFTFTLMIVAASARAGDVYVQTNLVSNGTVPNTATDPNMQGAWGLSFSTTSPFWVSDQAANFTARGLRMGRGLRRSTMSAPRSPRAAPVRC
jgi:hypothetical protein